MPLKIGVRIVRKLERAHRAEQSLAVARIRRLLAEEEPSVVAATLDALDARAEEPGVREWLGDFAGWRRPVAGEP